MANQDRKKYFASMLYIFVKKRASKDSGANKHFLWKKTKIFLVKNKN